MNLQPNPENPEDLSSRPKRTPGGSVRYNWDAMKLEFMRGPWQLVSDFRRDKGLPSAEKSSYFSKQTKGWADEKRALISKATKEVAKNLMSEKIREIENVRRKHMGIARTFQAKGIKGLKTLNFKDVDEARKLILSGMNEERISLGITEKGGNPSSLTQVNVTLPKTELDEVIDAQDFRGVLKLVAQVKRERARRVGEDTASEGETETE
ncbi:MAG: hypothetical protein U1C56_00495 [Candidatus Curtissbacteria bacterium]|nr:hypothetical protein [Candidatus Curtissbacteria bacterium]